MKSKNSRLGRKLVWTSVILLAILHHDFWFWDDRRLVLGFMPIGLFYHAMFSIVAACLWALAVKFAWPIRLEEWASEFEGKKPPQKGGRP